MVSLTGIPENETPYFVIRLPGNFYPEYRGSRHPDKFWINKLKIEIAVALEAIDF